MATLKLIILSIVLLGIAFAGIAVKLLFKKNGKFAGTCSSNNPLTSNTDGSCSACGARPEDRCKS